MRDVLTEPPPPGDERIPYGPEPLQFGDRYGPGTPCVVFVHGGFWKPDYDLAHAGHACAALAAAGLPTLSLEYRRDGWRHTLDDVRLGTKAARVVVGHSAGGHLALCSGRPAVALAPVADLEEARRLDLGDGAVERFLGSDPEAWAAATPRPGPPQILIHGTADEVVPISLSERYSAATGARLVLLEGAGHFEPITPWSAEWPIVVSAIEQLL